MIGTNSNQKEAITMTSKKLTSSLRGILRAVVACLAGLWVLEVRLTANSIVNALAKIDVMLALAVIVVIVVRLRKKIWAYAEAREAAAVEAKTSKEHDKPPSID